MTRFAITANHDLDVGPGFRLTCDGLPYQGRVASIAVDITEG